MERKDIKGMIKNISGAHSLNNIEIERIILLCPDPRLMEFYASYIAILGAFPIMKAGGAFVVDKICDGYENNIKEVRGSINEALCLFPNISEVCLTAHGGICKKMHEAIPELTLQNEIEFLTNTLENAIGVFERMEFVQNGIIKKIVPVRFDIGVNKEIIPTKLA